MGVFSKLFSKSIKVKDSDLQRYFCVKHKKSGKKIKLNTKLEVPENCTCTFCYKNKPCETLKQGEYQLNGNSLPLLYKKGNYNKPNKRNFIPDYFFANVWFASTNNKWIEFDIDKFMVKDKTYGKQKICLSMRVNINIDDPGKFFKSLLYERPRISSKKVVSKIILWLETDIRKFLKRQCYNIDDFMCYTRGFNQELHSLLCERFVPMGINIVETDLVDIVMKDELVREINDNRDLSFKIRTSMQDFDIMMNNDGYKTDVNFQRSTEQMQGSIAEKYMTKSQSNAVTMDASDECGMVAQNQNTSDFTTNRYGEIIDGINLMDGNPLLGDLGGNGSCGASGVNGGNYASGGNGSNGGDLGAVGGGAYAGNATSVNGQNVESGGENACGVNYHMCNYEDVAQKQNANAYQSAYNGQGANGVENQPAGYNGGMVNAGYAQNESTQKSFSPFGTQDITPQNDADSNAMYDMANETMGGAESTYTTLYGQPTGYKICAKCGKQVPIYASFCPYCGNGDLRHNL